MLTMCQGKLVPISYSLKIFVLRKLLKIIFEILYKNKHGNKLISPLPDIVNKNLKTELIL